MKSRVAVVIAGAIACSVSMVSAAEISGKVTFKGTPPPERKVDFEGTMCGSMHTKDAFTRHYVVGADGGLANVLVYLKTGPAGKTYTPPTEVPVLDQVDCFYEPYVLVVMTNQKFKIRNSDALMHNVHAYPRRARLTRSLTSPSR